MSAFRIRRRAFLTLAAGATAAAAGAAVRGDSTMPRQPGGLDATAASRFRAAGGRLERESAC